MDYFYFLGQQKNFHLREILKHSLEQKQNKKKEELKTTQLLCATSLFSKTNRL